MINFRYVLLINDKTFYMANTITECKKYFLKCQTYFSKKKTEIKTAYIKMNDIDLLNEVNL